jgi:endo-1,4-beta-D-glucanase Y
MTVTASTSGHDDAKRFQAAFDNLDHGRIYVRICDMRRELGWSEERFNDMLRKLRKDGTIQLHAGDAPTMTEDDIRLSFTDENYYFYATMTWKKR